MKEHVAHRSVDALHYWDEPYVLFNYERHWYKVPFFVLDGMLNEKIVFKLPGEMNLAQWLNSWKSNWTEQPIGLLKLILKDEMPGMEAYRLYE